MFYATEKEFSKRKKTYILIKLIPVFSEKKKTSYLSKTIITQNLKQYNYNIDMYVLCVNRINNNTKLVTRYT